MDIWNHGLREVFPPAATAAAATPLLFSSIARSLALETLPPWILTISFLSLQGAFHPSPSDLPAGEMTSHLSCLLLVITIRDNGSSSHLLPGQDGRPGLCRRPEM